jgi:hypothetical protein
VFEISGDEVQDDLAFSEADAAAAAEEEEEAAAAAAAAAAAEAAAELELESEPVPAAEEDYAIEAIAAPVEDEWGFPAPVSTKKKVKKSKRAV